ENRPEDGGNLHFFRPGGHGISGHTSIVASISVPLDRLFFHVEPGDGAWEKTGKYIGKGIAYGLPLGTGWSRINDDKHYAWNVVLGLCVGYTVGSFVTNAHQPRDERAASWSVVPISGERGGMGLAVRWSPASPARP